MRRTMGANLSSISIRFLDFFRSPTVGSTSTVRYPNGTDPVAKPSRARCRKPSRVRERMRSSSPCATMPRNMTIAVCSAESSATRTVPVSTV
jgi:hypothetical protein